MVEGPVQVVETHTSLLFFVDDRVYKFKKSVDLGFLDFRERPVRRAACEAEVTLNRRLAPDVYLGVGDITGPGGIACDSFVTMRRMPPDLKLSTLIELEPASARVSRGLAGLGRSIASFHAGARTSTEIRATAHPDALAALWQANIEVLQRYSQVLDPDMVMAIERLSKEYLAGRGPLLRHRQDLGLIRDGHGDLQADDIFLLDDGPRILDCLEFDANLRCGDVLNDVAFLAMDLERLGAHEGARRFLDAYAEFSGENHPRSLEDFYIAYRAGVRSKVACLRWSQGEPNAAPLARRYAALALDHLRRAGIKLVLVGGLPGTGKSTVAAAVADTGHEGTDWTLLRSDVIRKELANLRPEASAAAPYGQGLYSAESRRRTYDELFRRARSALTFGESVILDASFADPPERARARELAFDTGSALIELECQAPEDIVARRIGARARSGADVSDADAAISHAMRAQAASEPWPNAVVIDTSADLGTVIRSARTHIYADQA